MQKLEKIVEELRRRPGLAPSDEEIINVAREYLQTRILQYVYQSKFGAAVSFLGGTCLRICYALKRYSEDLNFALDGTRGNYQFGDLIGHIEREIKLSGFDVSTNAHSEKTVQKAFVRISGLYSKFNLRGPGSQKIHIKLEVDSKPVTIFPDERESFFVTRHGEIFPILKHTLPTLFAGKILAVLHRQYSRGRDYYDLIWYLTKKTPINLRYLNANLAKEKFASEKETYEALQKKIAQMKPETMLKDVERFMEDPSEIVWFKRYHELFNQLRPVSL